MSDPSSRHTLADEHAELLAEVEARGQQALAALAEERWPDAEIQGLVGYLRYEVLDQAVNEERLLYPLTTAGYGDERIRQLVEDHSRLRDATDALAIAVAADVSHRDAERLAAALEDLRRNLERHLVNEQEVLSTATDSGIDPLRRPFRSHEWFSLTEGSVLDLDRLPREFALDAAIERLIRMRPGERLEVRSGSPLEPLEQLFERRRMPGAYGWVYIHEGPERWGATITRRPAPE
jgi:uncharacterized protein (DUF2249 family)